MISTMFKQREKNADMATKRGRISFFWDKGTVKRSPSVAEIRSQTLSEKGQALKGCRKETLLSHADRLLPVVRTVQVAMLFAVRSCLLHLTMYSTKQ